MSDPEEDSLSALRKAKSLSEVLAFTSDCSSKVRKQAYLRLHKKHESGYSERTALVSNVVLEPNPKVRDKMYESLFYSWHLQSNEDLIEFLEPFDVIKNCKLLENFFDIYFGVMHNVHREVANLVGSFRYALSELDSSSQLRRLLCTDVRYSFVWLVLARFCNENPGVVELDINLNDEPADEEGAIVAAPTGPKDYFEGFWVNADLSINVKMFSKLIRSSLGDPANLWERESTGLPDPDPMDVRDRKRFIFDTLVKLGACVGMDRGDWITLKPTYKNEATGRTGTFEPLFYCDNQYLKYLENSDLLFELFDNVLDDERLLFLEVVALMKQNPWEASLANRIRALSLFIGFFSVYKFRNIGVHKFFQRNVLTGINSKSRIRAELSVKACARYYGKNPRCCEENFLALTLCTFKTDARGTVQFEELVEILLEYGARFNMPKYNKPLFRQLFEFFGMNKGLSPIGKRRLLWKVKKRYSRNLAYFLSETFKEHLEAKAPETIKRIGRLQMAGGFNALLGSLLPSLLKLYFLSNVDLRDETRHELKFIIIRHISTGSVIADVVGQVLLIKKLRPILLSVLEFVYSCALESMRSNLVNEVIKSITVKHNPKVVMAILAFMSRINLNRLDMESQINWFDHLEAYQTSVKKGKRKMTKNAKICRIVTKKVILKLESIIKVHFPDENGRTV